MRGRQESEAGSETRRAEEVMWGKEDSTGNESEMCGRETEENNTRKGNEKQVSYDRRKGKKGGER